MAKEEKFVFKREGIRHVKKHIVHFLWRGRHIDLRMVDDATAMAAAKDPRCTVLEVVKPRKKPEKPEKAS